VLYRGFFGVGKVSSAVTIMTVIDSIGSFAAAV
jgi:hypothetical protein